MESSASAVLSHDRLPIIAQPDKLALTKRELEVLTLMAEGLTTKVIASKLGVTFKTAACHRGRILQKLSVDSTVSAVRWAIRAGIVEP
ncbi:MAG TPA: LuxR C-terminal-related transcriptional regulator [Bryobacteraceae bacterium]|jgi:DNA-binding NarL/FixJ family response regulator